MHIYVEKKTEQERCNEDKAHTHGRLPAKWTAENNWEAKVKPHWEVKSESKAKQKSTKKDFNSTAQEMNVLNMHIWILYFRLRQIRLQRLVCCILCLKKTRWIIPDGVYFSQACTIHRCLLEGVLFSIFLLLLYFCYIFFFDRMFCSWSLIICTNKQKNKMERTRESKKTQLNHTQCTLIGTKLRFKQSKQVNELWTRILFWYFILFVSINWPQQHCKTPLFLDVLFYFDFYELKSENK